MFLEHLLSAKLKLFLTNVSSSRTFESDCDSFKGEIHKYFTASINREHFNHAKLTIKLGKTLRSMFVTPFSFVNLQRAITRNHLFFNEYEMKINLKKFSGSHFMLPRV